MKTKLTLFVTVLAVALFGGSFNLNAEEKKIHGDLWFGYCSDVGGPYTVKMWLEDKDNHLYRVIFWKADNTRGSHMALRLEETKAGRVTFTNLNSGRKWKGDFSKDGNILLINRYDPEKTKAFVKVIKAK